MAQSTIGAISPGSTSGAQLATLLTNFSAAINSNNLGATRPSYITYGCLWTQLSGTTNSPTYNLYVYTPAGDILIATWNASSGLGLGGPQPVIPAPGQVAGVGSIILVAGSPNQPFNGDTVQLALANDEDSPPANNYYGTDGSNPPMKGWHNLPALPAISPQQITAQTFMAGFAQAVVIPANVNSALIVLIGAGGVASQGGRVMFTANVTAGQALTLRVGSFNVNSGVGTGTYFLGAFAGPGDAFGNPGVAAAPAGVVANLAVPPIILPNGQLAGNPSCAGGALIFWITKNV